MESVVVTTSSSLAQWWGGATLAPAGSGDRGEHAPVSRQWRVFVSDGTCVALPREAKVGGWGL